MKRQSIENEDRLRKMGVLIAYYRKLNSMNQDQLAEILNISTGYLSQIESQSKYQPISLTLLFDMADVFHIEPWQLLDFEKGKGRHT